MKKNNLVPVKPVKQVDKPHPVLLEPEAYNLLRQVANDTNWDLKALASDLIMKGLKGEE